MQSTRIDASRLNRPNVTQKTSVGQNGQQIDENYLNNKIMYLNAERQRIHDIAAKYGLVNNSQVHNLQLIKGPGFNEESGKDNLQKIHDQKDRIQEYHKRVNEKRKLIHEKQKIKMAKQAEMEQNVLN